MKKRHSTLLLVALGILSTAHADVEHGKKLFKQSCAFCHGDRGEKPALNQSKILTQLSTSEIVEALKVRKDGQIIGAGNAAKSRLSEEDMQSIAEFIQTLK
ncbi:c-type cytochrome [Pasteurella sp. PK-2025]|uniref:c-type cytochrome n=1 Tax=unclassified Pasteurella TaxID=2621516 RepID=UPI003C708E1C